MVVAASLAAPRPAEAGSTIRLGPNGGAPADPAPAALVEREGSLTCSGVPPAGSPGAFTFRDDLRWRRTALDGPGLERGDPTTLTWGFAVDGTPIPGMVGEAAAPSELVAFLDRVRGDGDGGGDLSRRPWFDLFEQAFAEWSEVSGIRYVYEPNDDGAPFSSDGDRAPGIAGVRADVRIGGHYIDGERGANKVAYNLFPGNGEMVIDTGNAELFARQGDDQRLVLNVLSHEHGHGLGLFHSCPVNGSKLMEPALSSFFVGPQEDDVLGIQRGYGDPFELPSGNDQPVAATDLGTLEAGSELAVAGAGIDGASDVDVFAFTVDRPSTVEVELIPTGRIVRSGPQESSGACSTGSAIDSRRRNDLAVTLLDRTGRGALAVSDGSPAGGTERLLAVELEAAGTYFLEVRGADDDVQRYRLSIVAAEPVEAPEPRVRARRLRGSG